MYCQCINLNLTDPALAASRSEITPRRRTVLVALHHGLPQIGLAPVPFRKIEAILGIPKSTCCNIYKHALKNATRRHPLPPATQRPELPQATQHSELPPAIQHPEPLQASAIQYPELSPLATEHPELPPSATQHSEWEGFLTEIDAQLDILYDTNTSKELSVPLLEPVEREEWEGFLSEIDMQLDILYDARQEINHGVPLPGPVEKPVSEWEAQVGALMEEPQTKDQEIGLLDLISVECLNSDARSGRPQALSEVEKNHLVAIAKRDWGTQHITWEELQLEANLGHVGRTTILKALHSSKVKAYVEECKFILDEDNKKRRVVCLNFSY